MIPILIAVGCIAVIVVTAVVFKSKTEEKEKMYLAAERIIQNELLDNALKNPFLKGAVVDDPVGQQLMVDIRVKLDKRKQNYVFNPAKIINIGRDRAKNQIIVNEAIVTAEHCRIYMSPEGSPILQDTSSNGTVIKRGLKSYTISNNQTCVLENGDCIIVGTVKLKLKLFYFDTTWM